GLVNGARLLDCRFLGVTGTVAGAALNMPTNNIVRGCVFRDCHVPLLGASSGSPACLVRMRAESLLADCVFTDNFGLSLHATCVNTETGVSTVSNCLFTANTNTYAACWAQDNVVVRECRFTGNSASYSAGALSTFPGTTVTNCVFADNTAHFFGGALITRSTLDNPTRVVDCVFANNTAGAGGAVSVGFTYQLIPEKYDNMVNGYLLMDRCLISNNVANVVRGHGTYLGGGGIFVAGKAIEAHSGGEITNCQIVDNHSDWEGGGLCVRNWTGSSGFTGSWPLLIRNCLIARNSAGWEGGGLYIIHNGADGRYVMDSCTVVSNTAASTPPYTLGSAGHGLYHKLPGFFCTNTVFALNTLVTDKPQNFDHCCFDPAQGLTGSGAVNMTPSSGDSATNSKTCDARLANPDAGDYRLATASSPCCNAGLMEAWMADAVDLDGNARVFSSAPDMGCYELSWPLGTYLLIR
ncbi:MAG: right-handed parallel beta-helix repeat-containing protein, partial [Kiritimatiellia bacterium]